MTAPTLPRGTLILVAGSRSLAASKDATAWAKAHLTIALIGNPGAVALTGGADGPDTWAEALGLHYGRRVVVYRPDGTRRDSAGGADRWPGAGTGRDAPLVRNAAMVRRAAQAEGQGWRVLVLGLVDEASRSHGSDHCLSLAREAGLRVWRRAWAVQAAVEGRAA